MLPFISRKSGASTGVEFVNATPNTTVDPRLLHLDPESDQDGSSLNFFGPWPEARPYEQPSGVGNNLEVLDTQFDLPFEEPCQTALELGPNDRLQPDMWTTRNDVPLSLNGLREEVRHTLNSSSATVNNHLNTNIHQSWRACSNRAKEVCKAIAEFKEINYFPNDLRGCIQHYSNQSMAPFCVSDAIANLQLQNTLTEASMFKLHSLLMELSVILLEAEDIRTAYIVEHWLDPGEVGIGRHIDQHETSDSYSDDEDEPYFEMRLRLADFADRPFQRYYKTKPIKDGKMRRDIRAWARLSSYCCIKLRCGSMLIHKDREQLPRRRRRKQSCPAAGSNTDRWLSRDPEREGIWQYYRQSKDYSYTIPLDDSNADRQIPKSAEDANIWRHRGHSNGYSSGGSSGSHASVMTNAIGSKKRRLPKDEGGYPCTFTGCDKTFDRQCDLTHHQRSHRPKDSLPYPCESCDKRFPFPKDLRRHEKSCRKNNGTSGDY